MLGHKQMPSREGGVEVVVTELATRMAAMGHDVTVYSRADSGKQEGETEYEGVRVRTVNTLNVRGLAAVTSSFFAVEEAIEDCPDVIHFHAEGPCAMIPLAKRANVRTVATVHGLDWRRAKWGRLASGYIKLGERAAVRHADEIIVLSRSVQGYFEGAYGRHPLYIPNGVDEKTLMPPRAIREKYGLGEGSYVLYLGRVVPEKGLHHLLEAYCDLGGDMRLVIAGGPSDSGDYYKAMRAMAAGDGRVLFTGFVEGRELEELFSNAYAYVLPSDLEGMPMSLLEAMAYGRCCLTSDVPECTEVLGKAGVTFKRGDVKDLRVMLAALLSEPAACCALGVRARERVAELFNWDEVARRTLAVYEGEEVA